jgi:hypothetical protein
VVKVTGGSNTVLAVIAAIVVTFEPTLKVVLPPEA